MLYFVAHVGGIKKKWRSYNSATKYFAVKMPKLRATTFLELTLNQHIPFSNIKLIVVNSYLVTSFWGSIEHPCVTPFNW